LIVFLLQIFTDFKKTLFLFRIKQQNKMILENVDVVNDISKEDFQKNYFKKHKPLLIKNFASRWDAFDKWNLAYIREKAGDQEVPLYDNKPADASKSSDAPVTHMKMKD